MTNKDRKSFQARLRANDKRLQAQIESFGADLRLFLSSNLYRVLERLKTGKVSAQEAAAMLGSLDNTMQTIGIGAEIEKLEGIYLDELDSIKEELEIASGKSAIFSDADADSVIALIQFESEVIANKVTQHIGDIKPIMMRAILAGEDIDVRKIIETDDKRLIHQIQTEVDTAVLAFSRTVTTSKAEELGLDTFEYIGPDDGVTRPFCRHLLEGTLNGFEREDPFYKAEEIDRMDNGQDLPVMEYGGGYNCRHRWRAFRQK